MFSQLLAGAFLAGSPRREGHADPKAHAQVTATGTMGVTNPTAAVMGTPINQTSYARLASLNAIDDFCIFAPPEPNSIIGETEHLEVAWCVQPRNNARVIPDGTFTSVHFVKTPLYWQVQGFGDFTKINIASGDQGGELDPHGATGAGNPVGGNVTANATGTDVSYEEWMNYMSYEQFCLRICIAENSTYPAAIECQHTIDEMGCQWVMPGDYTDNSFTECEADAAYPPGVYPLANGSTSTFAQRYTGTYTAGGVQEKWTIGVTVTPSAPFSTPASSSCTTYKTIGNGIPVSLLSSDAAFSWTGVYSAAATGTAAVLASGDASSADASGGSSDGDAVASASASPGDANNAKADSNNSAAYAPSYAPVFAGVLSLVAAVAGAGCILL